jgi:hypothetical protein
MARGRWIKPEFFEDPKIAQMSFGARLLFIGIWTQSDDVGNCQASPGFLRSRIFPNDDVTLANVEEWLSESSLRGRVVLYEADGEPYLHVVNFARHQRINRPSVWKNPSHPTGSEPALSEPAVSRGVSGDVSRGVSTSHLNLNLNPNPKSGTDPLTEPSVSDAGWSLVVLGILHEALPKHTDQPDGPWMDEIRQEFPDFDLVFAARAMRDEYLGKPGRYGARTSIKRSFRSWMKMQVKFDKDDRAARRNGRVPDDIVAEGAAKFRAAEVKP